MKTHKTKLRSVLLNFTKVGITKAIEAAILVLVLGFATKYLLVVVPVAATASVVADGIIKRL